MGLLSSRALDLLTVVHTELGENEVFPPGLKKVDLGWHPWSAWDSFTAGETLPVLRRSQTARGWALKGPLASLQQGRYS